MKILLIGSGGREHALAWKLAQSAKVEQIYVAPGNGGTAQLAKCENVSIAANELPTLRHFALQHEIDLTVVGPAAPLMAGIVDYFEAAGLRIFGPSKAAARLEGSKAFSKKFMLRQGIPTAQAHIFDTYPAAIRHVMAAQSIPVIKVSGLAGGKGVYVPDCFNDAETALHEIYLSKRFGDAGRQVLIEERLFGPELSVLALCDGEDYILMPAAQDHKRLRDNDEGPNTGGMAAFAPSPLATPELLAEVEKNVIRPTLAGMAKRGRPYVGVLYAGLMLTPDGIKVLEFNCRFGDPETQVILPLLESDLVDLFLACTEGELNQIEANWHPGAAGTVVMASDGYPLDYEKGFSITGIDKAAQLDGVIPFHAGSAMKEGQLVTAGGRVLAVSGVSDSLEEALKRAYAGIEQIAFQGAFYRKDIGKNAGK